MNYKVDFTDLTLLDTKCHYLKTLDLMSKEMYGNSVWMLDTRCTISSIYGMCLFDLHFYNDGKVVIYNYSPSDKNVLLTEDIQYLSEYLQLKGWKKPEPYIDLVKSQLKLWKFYWETKIINCNYFENKYKDNNEEE